MTDRYDDTNDTDGDSNEAPLEFNIEDVIAWMGFMMEAQQRNYDCMLTLIAASGHGDKAKQLQELHEQGQFLYPPPVMEPDDA